MTKRRIALLISLMLAAPAAVVALEQSASTGEATAEMTQPAETTAAPEVTATEPAAPEQIAAAEPQAAPAPVHQPVATNPVSRFFGNLARSSTSDAFPEGSMYGDYNWKPMAAQQQYFARLEQQRSTMLARGEGFPMGSAEGEYGNKSPLPAQVAYHDRAEQMRLAASLPQPVARAEVVTPAPVSADQSAQAGSSEVVIADTSAIR